MQRPSYIRFAVLDPSLSNFGMVKVKMNRRSLKAKVISNQLVTTKKTTNKQIRVASDTLRRGRELHSAVHAFLKGCSFVIAEVPHGSQSAVSAKALGVSVGILASIDLPFIEVTANEVKLASVGKKTASKGEMITWAMKKHPEATWKLNKSTGKPTNDNEHIADAIAAIYAGMQTETFKFLILR